MAEQPHVFLTRPLDEAVLNEFRPQLSAPLQIHHDADFPPTRQELLEAVRGSSGLVTMVTDRVDAEVLDAAGQSLKVVANMAVGYDNIDVDAAAERGVTVTNTPGVLDEISRRPHLGTAAEHRATGRRRRPFHPHRQSMDLGAAELRGS